MKKYWWFAFSFSIVMAFMAGWNAQAQTAKTIPNRAQDQDLCLEVNDGGTPANGLCVTGTTAIADFPNGLTLPTTGGTAGTLDYYEEFSTSYAPTAGTQTVQVRAVRVGKLVTVTVWFSVVDTAVDSGNSSGSILPTTMYPPRKISVYHLQRDPTVAGSPCLRYSVEDAGEIRLQTASCADIGAGGGNWNGAMTSENVGMTMSYTVN